MRCDAGARRACLAILAVPGFGCIFGREHLDGQWAVELAPPLAGPDSRPGPVRVAAEEQTRRWLRQGRRCAMSSGARCGLR
jgi:hypothetical protein